MKWPGAFGAVLCLAAGGLAACDASSTGETTSTTDRSVVSAPTSAGSPPTTASSAPAGQSIELAGGRLRYTLPADATVDSTPLPNLPAEVIGDAKWLTDCCLLKVVVERIDPPMASDEAIETFSAGGLDWTVYDTGPRDRSQITAAATGDFGTVLVSAQAGPSQHLAEPDGARRLVVILAHTVAFDATA